jgi:hypothetical protein
MPYAFRFSILAKEKDLKRGLQFLILYFFDSKRLATRVSSLFRSFLYIQKTRNARCMPYAFRFSILAKVKDLKRDFPVSNIVFF